jgi:hypothetical protein
MFSSVGREPWIKDENHFISSSAVHLFLGPIGSSALCGKIAADTSSERALVDNFYQQEQTPNEHHADA